ncbi:MAG: F0F1 ATP synthase subunit epsilon [Gemmatales bacterium]|nr:MAG: F0F1 ATP synthase subunit epsilon [Gemmatales bacterium]
MNAQLRGTDREKRQNQDRLDFRSETRDALIRLKVLLPNEVFLDCPVRKIVAEAANGHFCLLPRHIDFVAALVPGLMAFEDEGGAEVFLAIDEATLVKCGLEVLVSTRAAVRGGDLGQLQSIVEEQFKVLDERERQARSAAARLEAGLVRRFMEFDKG